MAKYIDLNYRPHSYFWAYELEINLSSEIKGAQRKALYEESVVKSEDSELDKFIQKPSLNDLERKLISKTHPSFMGGEFLPDRDFGEIEAWA